MRYSNSAQNVNVTPLEMLPNLEDLEGGGGYGGSGNREFPSYSGSSMLPPGQSDKFGKYIRGNHHQISQQSGMNSHPPPPPHVNYSPSYSQQQEIYSTPNEGIKTFNMPAGSPSCLDVAEHIANCPICSKFYNTDKTIYIIAIVVLAIICILLLKKVLDV